MSFPYRDSPIDPVCQVICDAFRSVSLSAPLRKLCSCISSFMLFSRVFKLSAIAKADVDIPSSKHLLVLFVQKGKNNRSEK